MIGSQTPQTILRQSILGSMRSIALVGVILLTLPLSGRAESSTAESIWNQGNARQRALQQVPQGATVTGTSCESFSVGMGNTRYRCTVTFTTAPGPLPKNP
jgi:hypothetical protein